MNNFSPISLYLPYLLTITNMYRATVTKSLQDLKQLDYGLAIFLSAMVGGLAGGILGPSIDLYFLFYFL